MHTRHRAAPASAFELCFKVAWVALDLKNPFEAARMELVLLGLVTVPEGVNFAPGASPARRTLSGPLRHF